MYGLGFDARSIRYTSIGAAVQSISNRCERTTWNASPASMSPINFSTSTPKLSVVR